MSAYNNSSILQPVVAPGSTGLYLFQVDGTSSGTAETLPLHFLINELDNTSEQCLILPQAKQDEIQRQQQPSNDRYESAVSFESNNQDYSIAINPQLLKHTNTKNDPEYMEVTPNNKSFIASKGKGKYISSLNQSSSKVQPDTVPPRERRQTIQNFVHLPDRVVPPRAVAVLPTALQMRRGCISPRRLLPARMRFGPLQGVVHTIPHQDSKKMIAEAAASSTPIFFCKKTNDSVLHIDVSDTDKSNWMGLLPLGDQSTANVWLYEEGDELYGITMKPIACRTPLALGYCKTYSEEHHLPSAQPVLDLSSEGSKQWWCSECDCAMTSSALLLLHMNIHHKDEKPPHRYRCAQCSRTFARLFTLKRHTLQCCTQQSEKPNHQLKESIVDVDQDTLCAEPNVDDTRVPSDESFQNYTNGLDFSTNLFDTDRMPNLDISGSSRSEAEFNPYSVGYKEDNCLANDIAFGKTSDSVIVNQNKKPEKILVSCPYCDQTIIKEKRRQHILRECPERRFKCQCGQMFNKKQKLAVHIHTEHSEELVSKSAKDSVSKKPSELPYKCEDCKHAFKRRGMLVNHLWRVHQQAAVIPLEKRVLHYPCAVCPKIYRAAAKRDRHMSKHHPDCEQVRAAPIEGGRRACEPAACAACPRQYASRAKLMQHVRAQHPMLALPTKTTKPAKSTNTTSEIKTLNSTLCPPRSGDLY